MKKDLIHCDQCSQPIEPAKGKISLQPLRGGLTVVVDNGTGNAGVIINQQHDFCGPTCVIDFLAAIGKKIRAVAPAAVKAAVVAILFAVCLCLTLIQPARSQIIQSMLVTTGLVEQPIQVGFLTVSNVPSSPPIAQHYLMVTNINTNVTYVASYGYLGVGQTGSNLSTLVTFSTNFTAPAYTNGSTWLWTIPQQYVAPGWIYYGSILVGTNPTGILFQ